VKGSGVDFAVDADAAQTDTAGPPKPPPRQKWWDVGNEHGVRGGGGGGGVSFPGEGEGHGSN
jgi:hypothetical protein